MKRLKKLGLLLAMALVATCGVVVSASATTVDPVSTAVTLTSTNIVWKVSNTYSFICPDSKISATTPASTPGTWVSATITTLTFSSCAFTVMEVTVTPSERCQTPAFTPKLDLMSTTAGSAIAKLTLPAGCDIDISIPLTGCGVTITGGQAIGDGTAGTGGIQFTDLTPRSWIDFNQAVIPSSHILGTGLACVSLGTPTGALQGNYIVSSATNMTVT
jgi:hypothetical protein